MMKQILIHKEDHGVAFDSIKQVQGEVEAA